MGVNRPVVIPFIPIQSLEPTHPGAKTPTFKKLALFGCEHLPADVPFSSLVELRAWAAKNGMLFCEDQLVLDDEVKAVCEVFATMGEINLAVQLFEIRKQNTLYYEQVIVPTRPLISAGKKVAILSWTAEPNMWDSQHTVLGYWNFLISLWYPGLDVELLTTPYSRRIMDKLSSLSLNPDPHWDKISGEDQLIKIISCGELMAKFIKVGRGFDVEFSKAERKIRMKFDKLTKQSEEYRSNPTNIDFLNKKTVVEKLNLTNNLVLSWRIVMKNGIANMF